MNRLRGVLLVVALQLTASAGALELTTQEAAGKRLYREGFSSSGAQVTARVGAADMSVPGSVLPCANCHGNEGAGKPEGGVRPPVLSWQRLVLGSGTRQANGREYPAYTEASLARAIQEGRDPAGNRLDPAMPPGSLMCLDDHLNIVQRSPLHGEPGNERFVDMAQAYDAALASAADAAAAASGVPLHRGVYAWVLGPQFETPAEIRMLRLLGAQAVGMSTVPETILARHAGLRVLGLSMFTYYAAGMSDEALSHAHTLATASATAALAQRLLAAVVPALVV